MAREIAAGLAAVSLLATGLLVAVLMPDPLVAHAAACTTTETSSGNVYTVIINAGTGCTYTLPAGVTKLDSYLLVGGGGGGGGGGSGSGGSGRGGSGGRGGVVTAGTNLAVPNGATLTITIGAGGAGGRGESGGLVAKNGRIGNSSVITVSGGSSISAAGGNGGKKVSLSLIHI